MAVKWETKDIVKVGNDGVVALHSFSLNLYCVHHVIITRSMFGKISGLLTSCIVPLKHNTKL